MTVYLYVVVPLLTEAATGSNPVLLNPLVGKGHVGNQEISRSTPSKDLTITLNERDKVLFTLMNRGNVVFVSSEGVAVSLVCCKYK